MFPTPNSVRSPKRSEITPESSGLRLAMLPLTECGADHHWFLTLVNRFDTPLNGSSSTLSRFKGTR